MMPITLAKAPAKEKLLAAAIEVFSRHGFEGASTRDIARAAGINHASISYHYAGKEALYAACLTYIATSAHADLGLQTAMETSGQPLTKARCWALLDDFIEHKTRFFLGRQQQIVHSRIILRELVDPTAAFDRLYTGIMQQMCDALGAIIACLTGLQPQDRQVALLTSTVVGQITVFQNARAVVLRRLKVADYSGRDIADIVATLKTSVRGTLSAFTAPAATNTKATIPARKRN